MLFRALLLGLWYDLSDVKLEAQLARNSMFRRFCRRSSINIYHRSVPDHIGQIRAFGGGFRRNKQPAFRPECRPSGGRIAIVDATVIEASQTRVRKRDPDAGSHIKVNAKGKMQAKWGVKPSQT